MNILITGGLGFIGRALTRRFLAEGGHRITIVDSLSPQVHGEAPAYPEITEAPEVTVIRADICAPGVLRAALAGAEVVYHLAAETGTGQSMYEVEAYYRTNVMGTAVLLEEMVKAPALRPRHLVLASSRSIYGEGAYVRASEAGAPGARRVYPGTRAAADMEAGRFEFAEDGEALVPVPTREDDRLDPRSLYAASKLAQEQMCEIACATIGVAFTALRLQNVYGPGQSLRNPYTGIISIFSNILKQDGRIDIFEDGEESRDFVYVDDVAEAFARVPRRVAAPVNIVNVGSGARHTVSEIVAVLEAKMGKPGHSAVSGRFRPGDIRHCYADISRMREVLGFTPATGLAEGLSATVDWALQQPAEADLSEKANRELAAILEKG